MQAKMWWATASAVFALSVAGAPALAGSAIIYQGPPPSEGLLAATFVFPDIGTTTTKVVFEMQGSARSKAANRLIGICTQDPFTNCGATATIYANPAQTHLALVPAVWTLTAPRSTSIQISVTTLDAIHGDHNTVWDANDQIVITATW